ncbi:glycosyltransferase [Bacillus salitolerans]|uniref:Glycosyltransferase n=1 Tax=Bacillus salitolerans TaxID=1437434 RepID=A0ABW4LPG7_9BACI
MNITAIVPVYNCQDYIEKAIQSLLKQTFPIKEIIIVDDGSNDGTLEIIEKLHSQNSSLKLVRQSTNLGVSSARNKGISEASNEWILFLDADDFVEDTIIERYTGVLDDELGKDPNYVLVYPAYNQVDSNGDSLQSVVTGIQVLSHEILGYEFVRNYVISPSGVLVKKEAIMKFNGFDTTISINEDWDLWLKLAEIGGFIYVDDPLVNIRRHPSNTTSNISLSSQAEINILKKYQLFEIKEAIYKRELSVFANSCDYVSILFRLEEWEKGFLILSSINESKNITVLFLKGIYYIHVLKLREAEQCFEQILAQDPLHGSSINNIGVIHVLNNRVNMGIKYLRKALELFPGYVDAHFNLEQLVKKVEKRIENFKVTKRELRPNLLKYFK